MLKDRLVGLRKEFKKTQADIAEIIDVSRPAYTAYEKGNRTPDYKILNTLADFYGVTTDYLLGRSVSPNLTEDGDLDAIRNDPSTSIMFKNWKEMNEDDRQEALEFIKYLKHKKKDK